MTSAGMEIATKTPPDESSLRRTGTHIPRLAVICDFPEEGWPSMDLCAEMLLNRLASDHAGAICAERVCPAFRRRFGRLPLVGNQRQAHNVDRLLNRFSTYPRHLNKHSAHFDLFHVIDHSYAHLVHALPAERTVVTCYDLDTFECLLDPGVGRSALFRSMTRHILSGLRKAACVACVSEATRQSLIANGLVEADRVRTVHLGVDPVFCSEPNTLADQEAVRLLGPADQSSVDLLHVGSTIPRKRIDVLLKVVTAVQSAFPETRIIRVGGPLEVRQRESAQRLGVGSILELPFVNREVLAAVYRRAALVLQPSEKEGFGLPVVEALACGTPVVASHIEALREAGGAAAVYCPVGNVPEWSETVCRLLKERANDPPMWQERRENAIANASQFSWHQYGRQMMQVYGQVLRRAEAGERNVERSRSRRESEKALPRKAREGRSQE